MYLVLFFDQANYQFITSLHSTRAAAEAAYEAFLRHYVIEDGETLPPEGKLGRALRPLRGNPAPLHDHVRRKTRRGDQP
jgi:hypothetical protein